MPSRRVPLLPVLVVAATLVGCEPSIPPPTRATVNYVVFDPSASQIPMPNDLAWMQAPTGAPQSANDELLQLFAAQRGFPSDMEVPVTFDVQAWTVGTANPVKSAPAAGLDPTTLTASTFLFLEKPAGQSTYQPVAPDTYHVDYAQGADRGTVTLHVVKPDPVTKSLAWHAGSQYLLLLRGGAQGALLTGGGQLTAMPTLYFLTRGVDLSKPENQALLPGTPAEQQALGEQLEALRQQYLPIFMAVEASPPIGFGWGAGASKDLASIQTFTIAPNTGTRVIADASAGVMPLPSDFLRDPVTGKVLDEPGAFGPLASGLATLDGFSTTALVMAQTSGPVAAETVAGAVFLYELPSGGAPVRVKEVQEGAGAGFLAEPYPITAPLPGSSVSCTSQSNQGGCFSTVIGLQPATLLSMAPLASLPPLKEATEYAVLVTDGVSALDPSAQSSLSPLQPATLGKMLLFTHPFVDASGKSLLAGQGDATAAGLEGMRQGVNAAAAALQAEKGITGDKIAMAYTFRTQTITTPALQIVAAPYQNAAAFVPGAPLVLPPASYPVPLSGVQEVLYVPVPTLDPIDVATGAMNPDPTQWKATTMNALVVVPPPAAVANACPAPASALKCAPLVVFQHGLGRTKWDVFAIASALASTGAVVAAIDEPLHGDNALCTKDAECQCPPSAPTCTPKCGLFPAGAQGDAGPSGACVAPSVAIQSVSGAFFVTGNLFRTRDAIRGDLLDTSALVLALAPPAAPTGPLAAELQSKGVAVDAGKVSIIGQSLGGIDGVMNLATNPRFGRGVLNVPGGTLTDVFFNSPSFQAPLEALLASISGLTPGTAQFQQFELQFMQIAKWVLDPADPINFARHVVGDAAHPTLPDLLSQKPAQTPKAVFAQYAICDQTIPNPYNLFLFDQMGLGQTPVSSGSNGFTAYAVSSEVFPNCTSASDGAHGFLLSPTLSPTATAAGQADATAYLLNLTLPTKSVRP